LPIGLRNRLAHDAPSDPAYFEQALAELSPLHALIASLPEPDPGEPWRTNDGAVFDGLDGGFRPRRIDRSGAHRVDAGAESAMAAVFAQLAGAAAPAADLRSLIRVTAPEELKTVLLGPVAVGRIVGRGGFATVHEGRLVATGQRVAVKV